MGIWRTPVYIRIGKGEDEEGQKKFAVLGAATLPLGMNEKTIAILEIELDIDEAYLDPIVHTKATISMRERPPDTAVVRAGLQAIDREVKDL